MALSKAVVEAFSEGTFQDWQAHTAEKYRRFDRIERVPPACVGKLPHFSCGGLPCDGLPDLPRRASRSS
jgi:hypothetical protein